LSSFNTRGQEDQRFARAPNPGVRSAPCTAFFLSVSSSDDVDSTRRCSSSRPISPRVNLRIGGVARTRRAVISYRLSISIHVRRATARAKPVDSPGENASHKHQRDADEHLAPEFGGTKFLAYRGSHRMGGGIRGEGRGVGWGSGGCEKHGSQGPRGDAIVF
jgi:hypothetical protein